MVGGYALVASSLVQGYRRCVRSVKADKVVGSYVVVADGMSGSQEAHEGEVHEGQNDEDVKRMVCM